MLRLEQVTKNYISGKAEAQVLKGISVQFRKSEFVSILGQSGCGKTTMLNLIGGLDKCTSGDIFVDSKSTRDYESADWDMYRNHRIGFVFQSYNLIPHLTIVKNVELALTIAGVDKEKRRQKALDSLDKVGLKDHAKKRPNQLSGGQMQRVAIARALICDPEIILADEPTGALDSDSGEDVMNLLSNLAKDRLVIMVTHNELLAEKYSTRIVKMKDGVLIDDTNPYSLEEFLTDEKAELDRQEQENAVVEENAEMTKNDVYDNENDDKHQVVSKQTKKAKPKKKAKKRKTNINGRTAISLSITNLFNKKGRTFITAFAGSIGIIGILLVLALSNGTMGYVSALEENALSMYPIEITETGADVGAILSIMASEDSDREEYPDDETIYTGKVITSLVNNLGNVMSLNDLEGLKKYLDENFDKSRGSVQYNYGTSFDVFCNYVGDPEKYMKVNPFVEAMGEALPGVFDDYIDQFAEIASMISLWDEMIDDTDLLAKQYDLLGDSRWPTAHDEVVIVVDKYNQISDYLQFVLGLRKPSEVADAMINGDKFAEKNFTVDELLSLEYKVMTESDYYHQKEDGTWEVTSSVKKQTAIDFVESNAITLKVVGVVRPKENVDNASIMGIVGYRRELVEYLSNRASESPIAVAQMASPDTDVVTGDGLSEVEHRNLMRKLGVADMSKPTSIRVYANSFKDKEYVAELVAGFEAETGKKIKYIDSLSVIMGFVETLTEIVSGVLIAFASISLIVSSIMIAIIVYTSVLERKKEIGVLRSIGASKSSISKVFVAESGIIGTLSGIIGVIACYVLTLFINLILGLTGLGITVSLAWWQPLAMFIISIVLAVVAGVVPAWIASQKDPVECLRTE